MDRWGSGQAGRPDRVGLGRQVVEGGGTMTLPPERIGDKGQRFIVQTTGWPNHDAMGWQNAAYADTKIGASKLMRALLACPGVKHSRTIGRGSCRGRVCKYV